MYLNHLHINARCSGRLSSPLFLACFMMSMGCMMGLCTSCSTGIEGTRTIKMSRSEIRESLPSDEDRFAENIVSRPFPEWRIGKEFLITDDKAALVYEFPATFNTDSVAGLVMRFAGVENRPTPGGKEIVTLRFNCSDVRSGISTVCYATSRSSMERMNDFSGLDLPMMIDMDMVSLADSLMRNNSFWTRSGLWYDDKGNIIDGLRFERVRITDVRPGNAVFPFIVDFKADNGVSASVFMNVKSASGIGAESRTFPSLFSLSDPRGVYPSVTDRVWDLIKHGKVEIGMTKEECRLALGSPSEINSGHTWGNLVDYWGYKDGTYLYFEDGRLVNYRH